MVQHLHRESWCCWTPPHWHHMAYTTKQCRAQHSLLLTRVSKLKRGQVYYAKPLSGRAMLQRQLQDWQAKVLSAKWNEDWTHTFAAQAPQVDSLYAELVPSQAG